MSDRPKRSRRGGVGNFQGGSPGKVDMGGRADGSEARPVGRCGFDGPVPCPDCDAPLALNEGEIVCAACGFQEC